MKKVITIFAFLICGCTKETPFSESSIEGGTWATSCLSNNGLYSIATFSFNGGNYQAAMTIYSDSSCAVAEMEFSQQGTYLIGGPTADKSSTIKLDITHSSFNLKPLTSTTADSFNSSTYCGFNNWATNVSQPITGLNCGGTEPVPSAGTKFYDIYSIENMTIPETPGMPGSGSTIGDLEFGYTAGSLDGKSEATRPDTLDGNLVYRR